MWGKATPLLSEVPGMPKGIVDSSPMIILLLDDHGKIQYISPYLEQLFDCKLHVVLGKDWIAYIVPPNAQEKMREAFNEALKTPAVRTRSCSILIRNNDESTVEWREQPIYDEQLHVVGLLAVGLDSGGNAEKRDGAGAPATAGVNESSRAHQTMQMMRFSIDHMEDKMTWTDETGKIIYANTAACHSLEYTLVELLSLS